MSIDQARQMFEAVTTVGIGADHPPARQRHSSPETTDLGLGGAPMLLCTGWRRTEASAVAS